MKILCIASWSILLVYVFINIWAGSATTPKELLDKYSDTYMSELEKWNSTYRAKIWNAMVPIWRFNRYIYTGILLLVAVSSIALLRKNDEFKRAI